MNQLTHIDTDNKPTMVNITEKSITCRSATAMTTVTFPENLCVFSENSEIHTAKGPVLATAIIAGTMAVKRTHELIPFCHQILIEGCKFEMNVTSPHCVQVSCIVTCEGKTGVEMEAIIGAQIAAATIYDMCKALTHDITIGSVKLMAKSGGKRDFKRTPQA
jgi:cyclic pyranopterin phosphate synthase